MLAKLKAYWLAKRSFSEVWPVIALLVISVFLCVSNYTPGTFLSGWDTLHPEFNFGLAFQRTIFGVFRPEQGLGAVAAHSQMADLPRIIILYIFHFVLPLNFLRYFYVFLNMIAGTLGMYFFLNKFLLKQKIASFLGALFYLLNVGTVQVFNVPFEMFTTLFATLPFLFYFATGFITEEGRKRRNLGLFAVFTLFNTPSAYAATLWYVFFLAFLVYFVSLSLIHRKKDKNSLKNLIVLISVFIVINLFWLIPNIYFIINHGSEVQHANINLLFSDQAFLKNKEFGTISNILLLKSFYFDWGIYQGNNNFTDLLAPFINHFNDIKVVIIAYLFGLSSIGGLIYSFKKLGLKSIPLFLTLLFSLFFLINDNFPFSSLFNFFQNHIPFFKEAFRFPDDKILNIYVFLVSIFFGYFCLFITDKLKNIRFKAVFMLVTVFLIVYYSLPSFMGNYINPYMRVDIPNQYFRLFDYLDTQPESMRVANLPINSPWGWVYYDWGYQGSGFLYFGIKQPLLDRDFDRWSPYNESYYREMSYALYKNDKNLLASVINKYKIGFIFIDRSVIDPQNPKSVLYFDQSENLIKQTGLIQKQQEFGTITLFTLKTNTNIVSSANTNVNVQPSTTTTYRDFAYGIYKDYITAAPIVGFNTYVFPFRDLIDNQSKLHRNILNLDNEKITLNPLKTVSDFQANKLFDNYNIIPSDLVAQRDGNNLTISLYLNTPIFDDIPSTSPIKATLDIGSFQRNLSLSVNENELFNLNILPEATPIAIGKANLKNRANQISIYDTNAVVKVDNVSKIINPFFSSCNGDSKPPQAGFDNNGAIQITGKGDICILIPYGYFPNLSASDILTDFQFQFQGDADITSCMFDQDTSSCKYYKDPIRQGDIVSFPYAIQGDKTGSSAIKIFINAKNTNENKYILGDLTSWYSKSIANFNLSKESLESTFINSQNISFDKLFLTKNIIYDPGFKVTDVQKFSNDCDSSDIIAGKTLVSLGKTKAVEYSSKLGSFCDHFSYQNLPHNQAYLLVVESKNEAGLPLTLCVTNYTSRRCDIYADLSSFKAFDKDVFLLPPMDDNGIGYDINLSNLGIKGSPSVNYLSSVDFIPIPYDFLENIKTETQKGQNKLNGQVESVIQYNPAFFLVKTSGNPTIVNLDLSYEKGFRAYPISCSSYISCVIKGGLSPFFAKEIPQHVLVDNWSNGWIVNSGNQIVILYLPQYLEYFGFVLIGITFCLVIYWRKTAR